MTDRGSRIDNPQMAQAFLEGFAEGLVEMHAGLRYEIEVTFPSAGKKVTLNRLVLDDIEAAMVAIRKALEDGCSITVNTTAKESSGQAVAELDSVDDD